MPTDDRDPLKHRIAERNRENDKQHLIYPITAAYIPVALDKRLLGQRRSQTRAAAQASAYFALPSAFFSV